MQGNIRHVSAVEEGTWLVDARFNANWWWPLAGNRLRLHTPGVVFALLFLVGRHGDYNQACRGAMCLQLCVGADNKSLSTCVCRLF